MFFNKAKEFVGINNNLWSFNISSFFGNSNGSSCGFEVTSSDIKPLINESSLVKIVSIEFIAGGSKISDDSVGWEEGSLFGFKERKSIENWDTGKIGMGIMLNFFDLDFEGIDDRFYFSVSVVGDTIIAEVKLHCWNQIIYKRKLRYFWFKTLYQQK